MENNDKREVEQKSGWHFNRALDIMNCLRNLKNSWQITN